MGSGQWAVGSSGDIVIIYGQHNSKILVKNVSTFFVHDYTDNGIKGQCVCGVETCRPRVSTPHAVNQPSTEPNIVSDRKTVRKSLFSWHSETLF